MANYGDVYGSGATLNAADLVGKGDVPVTFESFRPQKFDDGTQKLLAKMRGKEKALAINWTNAQMCAEITQSDDYDDWVGLRVLLYVTKVPFGGKMVDAIRIKPLPSTDADVPARRAPKPAPPMTDEDIAF